MASNSTALANPDSKRPATGKILSITSAAGRAATLSSSPPPAPAKTLYQATLPTMVLAFRDNHDFAVPIAAGEVFEVVGAAQDDRFVIVNVKGQEFLIFAVDLKRTCQRVAQWQAQRA
ncbi:MAG TPA: hypothetical protein VKV74_16625 [Bryobacteraceae bacterium]|nr:hypothetical protein [Bryobacteraceae bacterium]